MINPDDIVWQYGADSLRLYEMFMGPLRETKVGGTCASYDSSRTEGSQSQERDFQGGSVGGLRACIGKHGCTKWASGLEDA